MGKYGGYGNKRRNFHRQILELEGSNNSNDCNGTRKLILYALPYMLVGIILGVAEI